MYIYIYIYILGGNNCFSDISTFQTFVAIGLCTMFSWWIYLIFRHTHITIHSSGWDAQEALAVGSVWICLDL